MAAQTALGHGLKWILPHRAKVEVLLKAGKWEGNAHTDCSPMGIRQLIAFLLLAALGLTPPSHAMGV